MAYFDIAANSITAQPVTAYLQGRAMRMAYEGEKQAQQFQQMQMQDWQKQRDFDRQTKATYASMDGPTDSISYAFLAELRMRAKSLGLEPFDAAMTNPPFFDDSGTLRGPAPERRAAWMADDGLAAWIGFMSKGVREGGTLTLIHRADRLADILALLGEKCGGIQILPIHPFSDEPAKRVLVRAIKTGKAPLRLLPALVLHDRDGDKHRPEVEAILRGEAAIRWAA